MALRWCRRTLGTNPRKRYEPAWYVVKHDPLCSAYGVYDAYDNEVWIFWDNCPTVEDLIRTCIHEWKHQLQPILTRYDYDESAMTNPYEIEARAAEAKWLDPCWQAIKGNVNKKFFKYETGNREIKGRRGRPNAKDKSAKGRQAKVASRSRARRHPSGYTFAAGSRKRYVDIDLDWTRILNNANP